MLLRPRIFLVYIVLLSSCFNHIFEEKKDLVYTYNLDTTTKIQVYAVGHGSTTNGYTEIWKKSKSKDVLIKVIDVYFFSDTVTITSLNDTLLKITFTDTANFKGMNRSFIFNLNERSKH